MPQRLACYPTDSLSYPLAYSIEVAVEEEISEELSQETWLSDVKIEKAIEETVEESNGILETLQEAIEEHQADVEDAINRQAPALPTSPTPESLGHGQGQGSVTPGQQALHVARDNACRSRIPPLKCANPFAHSR